MLGSYSVDMFCLLMYSARNRCFFFASNSFKNILFIFLLSIILFQISSLFSKLTFFHCKINLKW